MGMSSRKRPKLFQRSQAVRESSRKSVRIEGTCQVGERPAEEVLVTDLSPLGCRVQIVSIGVTKAEPVLLWLGLDEAVAGRLKWIKHGSLGVAFEAPLDDAALERLNAQPSSDNVVPLRRNAIP